MEITCQFAKLPITGTPLFHLKLQIYTLDFHVNDGWLFISFEKHNKTIDKYVVVKPELAM